MKRHSIATILFCIAFTASAAELRVPTELIATETVAVIDINIDVIKRPEFLRSITDVMGEAPSQEMQSHYDDFMSDFAAAGGATISIVGNMHKDMEYPTDGLLLVIGPQKGADTQKLSDYMFSFAPEMKQIMSSECPKEIGGSLVWYQRSYKLPVANAERYAAFARAYTQLPKNQSFTGVLLADNLAAQQVRANLDPQNADHVDALMLGNGICIFSNFGVVEKPAVKVLVLTPNAAGAEKLAVVASALFTDLKQLLPAQFLNAMDGLKVIEVGSNVQIHVPLPVAAQVAKGAAGAVAAAPEASPIK